MGGNTGNFLSFEVGQTSPSSGIVWVGRESGKGRMRSGHYELNIAVEFWKCICVLRDVGFYNPFHSLVNIVVLNG